MFTFCHVWGIIGIVWITGGFRGMLGVGGNDIFGGTEFFALHNGKWEYTVILGTAVWQGLCRRGLKRE